MVECMMTLTYLRKQKQGLADAFFGQCRYYIAAGSVPSCDVPCRVCDASKRFGSVLKFYAMRNRSDRPEREFFEQKIAFLFLILCFSIRHYSPRYRFILCEEFTM